MPSLLSGAGPAQASLERTFEGGLSLRKHDAIRTLCDDIWEELFGSIEGASSLRRHEKSVLSYLWSRCKTKALVTARYPGHEAVGAALDVSPLAVHAALVSLERKGLIRAVVRERPRRTEAYRLNAFVLECAYDRVRLKKTS
jgi:DNA-binding transcriptional ArsR family regulator